jgi:c-di-GMP-binding flagellar brake protein YcgR
MNTINVGSKIEVIYMNSKDDKGAFISQFEDIVGSKIVIGAPIKKDEIVRVSIGAKLLIYFIYRFDLYRFRAVVTDKYKDYKQFVLEIKKTGVFENVQRREFYRYKTTLDLEFRNLKEDIKDHYKGLTKDISGGGVCFVSDKDLMVRDIIICKVNLKDGKKIEFEGKIVRKKNLDEYTKKFEYGLRFYNIAYQDRETIIRYIFIEETKLRKKGLI